MIDSRPPPPLQRPWIYLASQSPRRRELLAQIGIETRLLVDDDGSRAEALEATRAGEDPRRYVVRVARAKAEAAVERLAAGDLEPAPVLAADTTVALGGTLFAKPVDTADAVRMLSRLQGQVHRVLTAVAVARVGLHGKARIDTHLQTSRVRFRRLKPDEIERYVASGEPVGKAGAYAIQGLAAAFVQRIDGSHSGIMGLPLYETARLLRRAGLRIP
jgi:septum formation protein